MRRAAALIVLAVAAPARADDAQAVRFEAATWPRRLIWRPLVLDRGMIEARLAATVGAELSITPALWIGVNRRLTVGVSYDPSTIDARFRLRDDDGLALAGRFALAARRFAPTPVALELGAIARLRAGDVAVIAAPSLAIGLTRRDLDNRERAELPVTLQWQATGWLAFELGGGLAGPVEGLIDALEVPVRAGAIVSPRRDLDLGLSGGFPDAAATDDAEATAWLSWRH